jgi:hypothetical protein
MRQGDRCKNAKVLVVSTSDSSHEQEEVRSLGANAFFRKPGTYDEFMRLGILVKELCGAKQ